MLGLDGIINMEKIYKVQNILEVLSDFHRHYFEKKTYGAKWDEQKLYKKKINKELLENNKWMHFYSAFSK